MERRTFVVVFWGQICECVLGDVHQVVSESIIATKSVSRPNHVVPGNENVAAIGTKPVGKQIIDKVLKACHFVLRPI